MGTLVPGIEGGFGGVFDVAQILFLFIFGNFSSRSVRTSYLPTFLVFELPFGPHRPSTSLREFYLWT